MSAKSKQTTWIVVGVLALAFAATLGKTIAIGLVDGGPTKLLQTVVNTVALGSMYALTALGYTLVYGVLRFINFAHSDVFTFGAWISFAIASAFGWAVTESPLFAMPMILLLAMAACAALGVTIEALAYRPLRRAPRLNVLITAIGVSLLLQNVGQLKFVFGTQPQHMPALIHDSSLVEISGVHIRVVDVTVVLLAAILLVALEALVYRTKLGRAMRATSQNPQVARLMGVNTDQIISITFVIGAGLAAIAGVMVSAYYHLAHHLMGSMLGLKAFTAAVLGGIGNLAGAMMGGILLGIIESLGAGYIGDLSGGFFGSHYQDVFAFLVLIVVLVFRPSGLFGERVSERA